ncbi:MAG: hypothetical protein LC647_11545, partial [Beggiatoa sp.]|nr:hypothetical protein [Beggiatoa sp.]
MAVCARLPTWKASSRWAAISIWRNWRRGKATVHASAFWIQDNDDPSADYVGNFDEVSNLAALETVRLYQAYLK